VSYSSLQTFLSTDAGADLRGFQYSCTAQEQQHIRDIKESPANSDIILKNNNLLPVKIATLNAVLYNYIDVSDEPEGIHTKVITVHRSGTITL